MNKEINAFNQRYPKTEEAICTLLAEVISETLPDAENKIWHGHPVWFINGNPIVGYDKLKDCVRLLFWSGQSFEEKELTASGKFKAAEMRYTTVQQVEINKLKGWLQKSKITQWDYKNIVKRKGRLDRLM